MSGLATRGNGRIFRFEEVIAAMGDWKATGHQIIVCFEGPLQVGQIVNLYGSPFRVLRQATHAEYIAESPSRKPPPDDRPYYYEVDMAD